MNDLGEQDLSNLRSSFITASVAKRAQLGMVGDEEGAEILGRRRNANTSYAGIVYPYYHPENYERRRASRLRRDMPEIERKSDGTIEEKGKYMSAFGTANLVFFPPDIPLEFLTDTSLPLVITEGEKKGLALYRLATNDLTLSRWHFLPVAISGVWNFRGIVGKTQRPNGKNVVVKGFLTDFESMELKRRSVSILFDSNVQTNPQVERARKRLAKELRIRGAEVTFINLPDDCGVNGIDDLLATWEKEHGTATAIDKGLALLNTKVQDDSESTGRQTQSAKLVQLVQEAGALLFHTGDGRTFASIVVSAHYENYEIRSAKFKEWIGHRYWNTERRVPSARALTDAVSTLNGIARYESPQEDIFVRLAELNGCIYVDLGSDSWEVVEVSTVEIKLLQGYESPVKFWRPKGLVALPHPQPGLSVLDLRRFINVIDEHFQLVLTWIICSLRTNNPFNGEQGSAKSTTARVLRSLIDPNLAGLRTCPRDERDLMIAASNGWILSFDNLSRIPDWLSDAFCRVSTGGALATRTLYENNDETLFTGKRPLLLNGITELASRADLLDRALIISCPNISKQKRVDEETFWRQFEKDRPGLFGAILRALSETLNRLPNVTLSEPERMADFNKLGIAAEAALGFAGGSFQRCYSANRKDAVQIGIESSTTAMAVIVFMAERDFWKGSATQLLKELCTLAQNSNDQGIRLDDLPKKPNILSAELKQTAPNLRARGIEFERAKSGGRTITLQTSAISPSKSSEPSRLSENENSEFTRIDDADDSTEFADDDLKEIKNQKPLHLPNLDDVDDSDDNLRSLCKNDAFNNNYCDQRAVAVKGSANGKDYGICKCGQAYYIGQACPFCGRINAEPL